MATSDAEEGDRPGDVSNTINGGAANAFQAGDMTVNQYLGPSDDLIATKDEVIASQRRELALFEEQCELYKARIEELHHQRDSAKRVIKSLDYVSVRLESARLLCQDRLRRFGARPDVLTPPSQRADWERVEEELRKIEQLLADAATELRRAELGQAWAQRLDSLIQATFENEHPDQPLPEDVPVATVDPPRTSIGDEELLDRGRSLVEQSHVDNDRIELSLNHIESTLPAGLTGRRSIVASASESPAPRRRRSDRRQAEMIDDRDAQILALERQLDNLRDKRLTEEPGSDPNDVLVLVLMVALFVLLPCGMLATGILIHAAPKFPSASSTEHTVVLVLAAILFVVPIVWLYNWSKQTPGYVTAAAAALWIGGVVAGYFYAVVALLIAAVLFAAVAWSKRIGVGAIVGAGLTVLLGAIAPGFLWWSWTMLGGLSDLF